MDGQIRNAATKGLSVTVRTTISALNVQLARFYTDSWQGIILVGGLGGSPYLYEYLKAVHLEAGIAVLQSNGIKPYVSNPLRTCHT